MRRNYSNNRANFYNLDELKSIPIEEVCRSLGIEIEHKDSRMWVKLRREDKASALLHPEQNTFYDFGTQEFGDNIDLIALTQNLTKGESMKFLGKMFGIEPVNPRSGLSDNELNLWEYAQIGIYGDMVSKNLQFDFVDSDFPTKEIFALADKYSISMNELRKSNDKADKALYESILRENSVRQIQVMRTSYFMGIWNEYNFLKGVDALELFDTVCSKDSFKKLYDDIKKTEQIFNKAIEGTKIKKFKNIDFSPKKILDDILGSRLKPEFGPYNYKEMQALAEQEDCSIKYRVVDYLKHTELKDNLKSIPYSAFLDAGKVIIGYLEKDKKVIQEVYGIPENTKQKNDKSFNSLVSNAENRKSNSVKNYSNESIEK